MSDLTLDQKQNRLGNLLLAGNLYKSHQISKSINTLVGGQNQLLKQNREQHQQTMGVLRNTESIVNSQLKIITEVEKRKILKNIFFEINEEVEELEKNKKLTHVEKFCKYSTLLNLLENSKIDPSITEDLEEKKYIKDSIKKLKEQDENIKNNLSASDKKDLEEIYEILSNNEEYEILGKELSKKGDTIEKNIKNREEPKALHIGDDKELELSHFIRKKLKTTLLEYFNKKSRD